MKRVKRLNLLHVAIVCLLPVMGAMAFVLFTSCGTKQKAEATLPVRHEYVPEHSPSVFLVMYDAEIGKEPLLKAISDYKAEIVYDYKLINGMALKKPDDKTLEETMQYFKKVKGVTHVEYDRVYHLTDPVKPRMSAS